MLLTVVSSVTVNGVFHPALDLKEGEHYFMNRSGLVPFM